MKEDKIEQNKENINESVILPANLAENTSSNPDSHVESTKSLQSLHLQ
jgi:hypothetical protein